MVNVELFRYPYTMDNVFRWVSDNVVVLAEVLFGGAGVAVIGFLIKRFLQRQSNDPTQRQTSGDNSTNLQSGRDINIGERRRDSGEGP